MLRAKEEFNEFERKDIKHSERMKFFKEQVRPDSPPLLPRDYC